MPKSTAARRTLLPARVRRPRAPMVRLVPFPLVYAVVASCAVMILFGRSIEAVAICAVAAAKIVLSQTLAARARRTFSALKLTPAIHTPMTHAIWRLSGVLTFVVLGLAGVVFMAGLLGEQASLRMAAPALVVAAVPLELRAATSAILAASATRMVRRKTVIRRLAAVETIAATTVICTTRAGSLTRNELTVTRIIAGGCGYETTGAGYSPGGDVRAAGAKVSLGDNVALDECLLAGFSCNDAQLVDDDGGWQVSGDPLEAALLVSAVKHGLNKALPRVATLAFAPDRRFMATLHRLNDDEPGDVYVKGSVERVLYLCDGRLDVNGCIQELNGDAIRATAQVLTRRGLRVVAFAHAQMPREVDSLTELTVPRLTFLGLQAMHDPVLLHALDAIRACQDAGILVKMFTGDDATTAGMTAAWVGLDGDACMTGAELRACPADDLPAAVARSAVFARVSPAEKEMLLRALQSRRHVVAITGENDEDLPALRQSVTVLDVGPHDADGHDAGAENTRAVVASADLVLSGGDLALITAIVAEGRGMLDNLAKYLEAAVPPALGPGLVLATAALTGTTLPIHPVQLLWLSIVALLAVVGTALPAHPGLPAADLMRRRPPGRALFGPRRSARVLLVTALLLGGALGLFHWELAHGATVIEARTAVVNVLVFTLLAHWLSSRSPRRLRLPFGGSRGRDLLTAAVAISLIVAQLAYTYVPVLNDLFTSGPLDVGAWLGVIAVAASCFVLAEAVKLLPSRPVAAS